MRSMVTAVSTEAAIAPTSMIGSVHRAVSPSKKISQVDRAPKAPIMKISPWAKLISWTMPYTTV